MCGILLIDSAQELSPVRIARAECYLRHRGPNLLRQWHKGRIRIWHSVLHITGDADYYHTHHDDFCAFAGEVYNYRELGYHSDAWCVHDTVRSRPGHLRQLAGPSSWIYSTDEFVCYATDPQGERHLYRYQDADTTIVASEVALILALVDAEFDPMPYQNKTWTMLTQTPYRGIEKLEPGRLYINHAAAHITDSVFNWCAPAAYPSVRAAAEEFSMLWRDVMRSMQPQEAVTVSFSGGIDSGLIAAALPTADLLAIDMIGKDPNIAMLSTQLTTPQLAQLNTLPVTLENYAANYREMIEHTRMPAQSWSHVGKWLVAKHAGRRIVFTGAGADELFGGYAVYQQLDYSLERSHSPYSSHHDDQLWRRCLDAGHGDARSATLLLDYWHQIIGCDSPGLDRAAGAWGRETRNPFMHPRVMRFALALPWQLRVADTTKPVLRRLWEMSWPDRVALPKQGFAGHANDSLPWLGVKYTSTADRHRDWQEIAQLSFYEYCRTN
jgi:asparagine synthetase B (glutamine-hydrolysing)